MTRLHRVCFPGVSLREISMQLFEGSSVVLGMAVPSTFSFLLAAGCSRGTSKKP